MKKTVIVGATTNTTRYAYIAAQSLTNKGYEIVPIGIKKGEVFGEEILDIKSKPNIEDVDTVTMYIGPRHQEEWMEYIVSLNPKRIIFNPGTENYNFTTYATKNGIEVEEACTLVLLNIGSY